MHKTYALIENEHVSNLVLAAGPDSLPGQKLLEAFPHTAVGDALVGGVLPGVRVPTVEEARAAKLAEVMDAYRAAFAPVEAVYPAAEREGWPVQEAEARAVLADPAAETPVLSLLVKLRDRGETVPALAAKVLANAGRWRMLYATLTGQQQRMYANVSALADAASVQAYLVTYQLPEVFQ